MRQPPDAGLRQVGVDFEDAGQWRPATPEEHSTFAWVLHGMLERADFEVAEALLPHPEYAEWTCRRP